MVTIIDVANAAGVAPSTVSYVISGKRTISPQTRRLVEAAIRETGYRRRNAGAPGAAGRRTGVLALAAPLDAGSAAPLMDAVAGAADASRAYNLDLLLVTSDQGPTGLRKVTTAALADAVVVLDVEADDPRLPVLLAWDRPAVVVGAPGRSGGLTYLAPDHTAAGSTCVTHLAELGHRTIVHMALPDSQAPDAAEKFAAGVRDAGERAGARTDFALCEPSAEAVTRCLTELRTGDNPPTGLVVHETLAPFVLCATWQLGLRVPEDVSVVVAGLTAAGPRSLPELTTVAVSPRELGARAVELAAQQLDGTPACDELLIPRVTLGNSTGRVQPR